MSLNKLHEEIKSCRDCEGKFGIRPNPIVWSEQEAKIVQISQAPSRRTSECGKPFCENLNTSDSSWGRLIKWYNICEEEFKNPKNFYITALGHCYPRENSRGR